MTPLTHVLVLVDTASLLPSFASHPSSDARPSPTPDAAGVPSATTAPRLVPPPSSIDTLDRLIQALARFLAHTPLTTLFHYHLVNSSLPQASRISHPLPRLSGPQSVSTFRDVVLEHLATPSLHDGPSKLSNLTKAADSLVDEIQDPSVDSLFSDQKKAPSSTNILLFARSPTTQSELADFVPFLAGDTPFQARTSTLLTRPQCASVAWVNIHRPAKAAPNFLAWLRPQRIRHLPLQSLLLDRRVLPVSLAVRTALRPAPKKQVSDLSADVLIPHAETKVKLLLRASLKRLDGAAWDASHVGIVITGLKRGYVGHAVSSGAIKVDQRVDTMFPAKGGGQKGSLWAESFAGLMIMLAKKGLNITASVLEVGVDKAEPQSVLISPVTPALAHVHRLRGESEAKSSLQSDAILKTWQATKPRLQLGVLPGDVVGMLGEDDLGVFLPGLFSPISSTDKRTEKEGSNGDGKLSTDQIARSLEFFEDETVMTQFELPTKTHDVLTRAHVSRKDNDVEPEDDSTIFDRVRGQKTCKDANPSATKPKVGLVSSPQSGCNPSPSNAVQASKANAQDAEALSRAARPILLKPSSSSEKNGDQPINAIDPRRPRVEMPKLVTPSIFDECSRDSWAAASECLTPPPSRQGGRHLVLPPSSIWRCTEARVRNATKVVVANREPAPIPEPSVDSQPCSQDENAVVEVAAEPPAIPIIDLSENSPHSEPMLTPDPLVMSVIGDAPAPGKTSASKPCLARSQDIANETHACGNPYPPSNEISHPLPGYSAFSPVILNLNIGDNGGHETGRTCHLAGREHEWEKIIQKSQNKKASGIADHRAQQTPSPNKRIRAKVDPQLERLDSIANHLQSLREEFNKASSRNWAKHLPAFLQQLAITVQTFIDAHDTKARVLKFAKSRTSKKDDVCQALQKSHKQMREMVSEGNNVWNVDIWLGIMQAYEEVMWHIACAFCHSKTATKGARLTARATKSASSILTCVNIVGKLTPGNAEMNRIFDRSLQQFFSNVLSRFLHGDDTGWLKDLFDDFGFVPDADGDGCELIMSPTGKPDSETPHIDTPEVRQETRKRSRSRQDEAARRAKRARGPTSIREAMAMTKGRQRVVATRNQLSSSRTLLSKGIPLALAPERIKTSKRSSRDTHRRQSSRPQIAFVAKTAVAENNAEEDACMFDKPLAPESPEDTSDDEGYTVRKEVEPLAISHLMSPAPLIDGPGQDELVLKEVHGRNVRVRFAGDVGGSRGSAPMSVCVEPEGTSNGYKNLSGTPHEARPPPRPPLPPVNDSSSPRVYSPGFSVRCAANRPMREPVMIPETPVNHVMVPETPLNASVPETPE